MTNANAFKPRKIGFDDSSMNSSACDSSLNDYYLDEVLNDTDDNQGKVDIESGQNAGDDTTDSENGHQYDDNLLDDDDDDGDDTFDCNDLASPLNKVRHQKKKTSALDCA